MVFFFRSIYCSVILLLPLLSESSKISYQLLVPKILRKEIVKNWHDTFYAAHFGISKTLDGIKKDLHWYKMSEDVKFHVRCCAVCGRFRSLSGRPGAALQGCLIGHPVDRIGVGVVGPLPKSKNKETILLDGWKRTHFQTNKLRQLL